MRLKIKHQLCFNLVTRLYLISYVNIIYNMNQQTGSGLFSGLTGWLNKKQITQPDPDLIAKTASSPVVAPSIPQANEADAQKLLMDLTRQVQQANASRHDPQRLADIKAVLQGLKGGAISRRKRTRKQTRRTRRLH